MEELVKQFPQLLLEGIKLSKKSVLNNSEKHIQNIVICGMGGSGFGGMLVKDWLYDKIDVPINIIQRYNIPSYVNENTLFIASSYSGNTEETIAATQEAIDKNANVVGITSGGLLSEMCTAKKLDCIVLNPGLPPRAALPMSIVQLFYILQEFNILKEDLLSELELASNWLADQQTSIQLSAKKISEAVHDKHIMIYTDAQMESIAIRARQQLNENAKVLCTHHVIPEMNHNELVGWTGGSSNYAALFLLHDQISKQNHKRFNYLEAIIHKKTENIFSFSAENNNTIKNTLALIYFVDFISVEIAKIKEIDATEVEVIEGLKESLKNE
ncbi:MAG: bifunctional phosphoglucose/phosphomannose isomerase [Brumimicrobium sp.]